MHVYVRHESQPQWGEIFYELFPSVLPLEGELEGVCVFFVPVCQRAPSSVAFDF